MPGVKLSDNTLMIAVTEQRTKEEIDDLIDIMKGGSAQ
jgi:glycine cleavage system protein P-like pyridoxal-binding family